ncbi:hypothetical protein [Cellulomonas alba]|uniref:Uncharacterized protein n=1 Tax=Cellulomonas alba TaxID=3053467 RepID=A0ABT7SK47_9CELL|nr:hypothetical protein [Cellulomonas alba]MDM7856566.1 hypothetical protein [Cellulomonas alba]
MAITQTTASVGREQGPVPESGVERDLRRLALLQDREVRAARRRRSAALRTVVLRGGTARGASGQPGRTFR